MFATGFSPTRVWEADDVTNRPALGTVFTDFDGKVYQFILMDSGGTTGPGYVVVITPGNIGDMVTTTVSAPGQFQGFRCGVPIVQIPANAYGWVCLFGQSVPVRAAISCAKGTILNTTASGGQLDDDASSGAEVINGIVLETAIGGGAGALAPANINFPTIGRTL